tara:strand:+ start:147 stop:419 length:273 start_codon:yes stop_codon:yes gene_type:complete
MRDSNYAGRVPGHLYTTGYASNDRGEVEEVSLLRWAARQQCSFEEAKALGGEAALKVGEVEVPVSHATIGELEVFRIGPEGRCIEMVLPR